MTVAFCGGMSGCFWHYGRRLYALLQELTEEYGPLRLLLAGRGNFDSFVVRVLRRFQWEHPLAQSVRVCAVATENSVSYDAELCIPAAFQPACPVNAEAVEEACDAFMAYECDIAVTCSVYDTQRIARFRALLDKLGKKFINIYESAAQE